MLTELKEFMNKKGQILRGILVNSLEYEDKKHIVVMLGGFERAGTTEKKFKKLADKLAVNKVSSFRIDATDCGLSDGDFYDMTVESLADDLRSAITFLKSFGYQKFSIVAHSLAGCALSLLIEEINFKKIILIAPALNQKELLRLWFAQKNNKDIKIDWNNYNQYFNEQDFIENLNLDLVTKTHRLKFNYRLNNKNADYSSNYNKLPKDTILLIHGTHDEKVPLKSLNIDFKNKIIIEKGDHDLEQLEIIDQWLDSAVNFIK
jgi:esterase/lipase